MTMLSVPSFLAAGLAIDDTFFALVALVLFLGIVILGRCPQEGWRCT